MKELLYLQDPDIYSPIFKALCYPKTNEYISRLISHLLKFVELKDGIIDLNEKGINITERANNNVSYDDEESYELKKEKEMRDSSNVNKINVWKTKYKCDEEKRNQKKFPTIGQKNLIPQSEFTPINNKPKIKNNYSNVKSRVYESPPKGSKSPYYEKNEKRIRAQSNSNIKISLEHSASKKNRSNTIDDSSNKIKPKNLESVYDRLYNLAFQQQQQQQQKKNEENNNNMNKKHKKKSKPSSKTTTVVKENDNKELLQVESEPTTPKIEIIEEKPKKEKRPKTPSTILKHAKEKHEKEKYESYIREKQYYLQFSPSRSIQITRNNERRSKSISVSPSRKNYQKPPILPIETSIRVYQTPLTPLSLNTDANRSKSPNSNNNTEINQNKSVSPKKKRFINTSTLIKQKKENEIKQIEEDGSYISEILYFLNSNYYLEIENSLLLSSRFFYPAQNDNILSSNIIQNNLTPNFYEYENAIQPMNEYIYDIDITIEKKRNISIIDSIDSKENKAIEMKNDLQTSDFYTY